MTESRERLKSIFQRASVRNLAEITKKDKNSRERRKEIRLKMLKYSVPLTVSAVSFAHAMAVLIDYAAIGSICNDSEEASRMPVIEMLIVPVILLQNGLSAIIAWTIRKFRDNFGVNTEIQRIFCVFGIMLLIIVPIMLATDHWLLVYVFISLLFHAIVVISGFVPLYAQLKLERRVAACNFGDVARFEDVLFEDAAALLAFKQFLMSEFCGELLEFYGASFHLLFVIVVKSWIDPRLFPP